VAGYPAVQAVDAAAASYLRTDVGNGQLFAALQNGRLRFIWDEQTWLEWRDGRWRRDVSGSAVRAAKAVARELLAEATKIDDDDARKKAVAWALQSETRGRIIAMLAMASSELNIVVTGTELDRDPYLLACGNGTLDLRKGKLRDPDPADLITLGTDVDYKPRAPRAPRGRWDKFIHEVFDGDSELIAFVKRAYGSCCTGDTRDRSLFIQYGSRFNGKSTLNRAVQDVLGDFAHTAPLRVVMRSKQSEIPNEVAALARKRLVLVAETADGHSLDENRVKMLTGRDKVTARFLHHEWFEFLPEYKLFLFTNFKPKIDGSDGAIWDRVRLIPFNVSFADREDADLGAKLALEAEGILAWLVEGCLEWQKNGLGTCDAVDAATREYRAENDLLGRFVAERCEFDREHRVERKTLRAAMLEHFEDEGEEPPTTSMLGRALGERGAWLQKRVYRGVRLLEVT